MEVCLTCETFHAKGECGAPPLPSVLSVDKIRRAARLLDQQPEDGDEEPTDG